MSRHLMFCLSLVLFIGTVVAQESGPIDDSPDALVVAQAAGVDSAQEQEETPDLAAATEAASGAPKTLAGMSILGNEEAPKSLVIVPWKSSEIGDGLGVTDAIDERARPVDKEVFLREVRYYELRSGASD
ncbi:MAG: hypothetical protein GWN29_14275 [Gammaproteobacteria bacterium]|nr:hypothetical protein [Gammaproteobacteria bacterium]